MSVEPCNPAETMVWKSLRRTSPLHAIRALYMVGPVLGWLLGRLAALSLHSGAAIWPDLRASGLVPPVVWAAIASMGAMLVVLWIGHIDWALGTKQTTKSSVGWAKG